MTTREIVTAYLRAIEAQDSDVEARFLHPEVELVEHPSRMSPTGQRADLAGIRVMGERGRKLMASQRYEIRQMIPTPISSSAPTRPAWPPPAAP